MTRRKLTSPLRALAFAGVATACFGLGAAMLDTQDILIMKDGRELQGKLIEEGDGYIVFEYHDPSGITSTIRFVQDDIAEIKRDVEVETTEEGADEGESSSTGDSESGMTSAEAEEANADPSLPALYVVPLRGQMGTDIYWETYGPIIEDIQEKQPDVVIFKLQSSEKWQYEDDRARAETVPYFDMEDYVKLVNMFKNELSDFEQIMWIEDSQGISSLIALAWPTIYMHSNGALTGLEEVWVAAAGWDDADVKAKMVAAWSGLARGFVEEGGHSMALAEAMINPREVLSAVFKGRSVTWANDLNGTYVLDGNREGVVAFPAERARNFLISQESADSLDDLAFLLGYREYRPIQATAKKVVDHYVEGWRDAFEKTEQLFLDFQQHQSWATGNETIKYLKASMKDLQRIVALMKRWKAVEKEWQRRGRTILQIELQIEQLDQTIKDIVRGNQGGGRGGGGGGIGGGLGGGG